MEPRDEPPTHGELNVDTYLVSAETLDRLAIPLAVIHGYVQLQQRRVHQGKMPNNDELLQTLVQMEDATQAMKAELQTLRATVMRYRRIVDET